MKLRPKANAKKLKRYADIGLRREGFVLEATYTYTNPEGECLFEVLRYQHPTKPKTFRQRHPDGNGGWFFSRGSDPVAYRWAEIAAAPEKPVFFCEGEKDADRLAQIGFIASTVPNGKWSQAAANAFQSRDVYVLEDNDDAGRARAAAAAAALSGIARSIRVVQLPDLPPKGDISDWLDGGGNPEKLLSICEAADVRVPANDNFIIETVTEDAAAQRFADIYAGRLRYCHDTGSWFEWTGNVWQRNSTGKAFHFARMLARELSRGAEKKDEITIQKTSFAGGVERFSRADPALAVRSEAGDSSRFQSGDARGNSRP